MDSKEISSFIGRKIYIRKLGFLFILWTTLREWYIRKGIRKICQPLNKKVTVLDAGSGLGQHAYFVARKWPLTEVTAIEVDEKQVKDCNYFVKKIGLENIEFLQGDLSQFNFNNKFDIILCSSVLEHIEDDQAVLSSYHDNLKQNGSLLVYVPTSEKRVLSSLDRKIKKQLKETGKALPHEHVRYYSKEELVSKLEKNGFEIKDIVITYGKYGRLSYDIVTSVQYSSVFKLLFPFYLLLIHPLVLLLMWADYLIKNNEGNGLLIIASKMS